MSVMFSVIDYPFLICPWGLLGMMRRLDVDPAVTSWLDLNAPTWQIKYRQTGPLSTEPVIVIDDQQSADLFRRIWLEKRPLTNRAGNGALPPSNLVVNPQTIVDLAF